MAHNPVYRLNKIEAVQESHRLYSKQEIPSAKIYRDYIAQEFHISYRTYTNYLSVNVALERRKLSAKINL